MNIGVFGSTRKEYTDKMDEILKNLYEEDIQLIRRMKFSSYEIIMKNGDIYRGLLANNGARGYRWHKVYISSTVTKNMFDDLIYRKILESEISEEERVVYY